MRARRVEPQIRAIHKSCALHRVGTVSRTFTMVADEARQRLAKAQDAAHRMRLRLTVSAICVGALLWVTAVTMYAVGDRSTLGRLWMVPAVAGVAIAGIAVMPCDTRAIRFLYWMIVVLWMPVAAVYLWQGWSALLHEAYAEAAGKVAFGAVASFYSVHGLISICRLRITPPRVLLKKLWRNMRIVAAATAMIHITLYPVLALVYPDYPALQGAGIWIEVCEGILIILIVFICAQSCRRSLQSFLTRMGNYGEIRQAAIVANLIGGRKVAEVLALARQQFRGLPVDVLTSSDLQGSSDTGLFEKTVAVKLGDCDTFVSHSWHDNGMAKWSALCEWSESFRTEFTRSPLIWLDKACIDQMRISDNLACLPVYLAGCQTLLVLAGNTYSERMWCLIELFTWVRMGGAIEKIDVIPLMANTSSSRALSEANSWFRSNLRQSTLKRVGPADHGILDQLLAIDAKRSKCFIEHERQRLLAIIESGCGGIDTFNEMVRHIFRERYCGNIEVIVDCTRGR